MEKTKYYFEIFQNGIIVKEGIMLWEDAWSFALKNNCTIQQHKPKKEK